MANKLDLCEKELSMLLTKVDNTRECLINAIQAVQKAKISLGSLPNELKTNGDLTDMLNTICQKLEVIQEKSETNEEGKSPAVDNNDVIEDENVKQTDSANIVEKNEQVTNDTTQADKQHDSFLDNTPVWTDVKNFAVKATSSLLPDGTFWCMPVDLEIEKDFLKEMSDKLRRGTMQDRKLWNCDTSNTRQLICVLSKSKNSWLRGVIEKELSDTEVLLRYIDTGRTEKMPKNRLNRVPHDLEEMQSLALHCCFQEKPIKVSYEMKWQFKDLTNDQQLSLNINEKIKGDFLDRYIVSLRSTYDESVDIGQVMLSRSKNDEVGTHDVLPSKDVRYYSGIEGQNDKIAIIRDVHNYKNGEQTNGVVEDAQLSTNKETEGDDKKNPTENVSTEEKLTLDFEEPEEKISWADMSETPDARSNEDGNCFFSAKDQCNTDNDDKVDDVKDGPDEAISATEDWESDGVKSNDDKKIEIEKDVVSEKTVEKGDDMKQVDGDSPGNEKSGPQQSAPVDDVNGQNTTGEFSVSEQQNKSENTGGHIREQADEVDGSNYVDVFEEPDLSRGLNVMKESELVIQQRLEAMSKQSSVSERPLSEEENRLSETSETAKDAEKLEGPPECEEVIVNMDKTSEDGASMTSELQQQADQNEVGMRSERSNAIEEKDAKNMEGGDRRKEDSRQRRMQFRQELLNGLSNPALDHPKARYFCFVGTYKSLTRVFSSNQLAFPTNKALKDALMHPEQSPIVFIILAAKSFQEAELPIDARICAIGIGKFNRGSTKSNRDDIDRELIDVDVVCRGKAKKLWTWNYGLGNEIPRNDAHKILRQYDGFIRNNLVDEFKDYQQEPQGQRPQQQAPWLKRSTERARPNTYHTTNQTPARVTQSDTTTRVSPISIPTHETVQSYEPEELWSPGATNITMKHEQTEDHSTQRPLPYESREVWSPHEPSETRLPLSNDSHTNQKQAMDDSQIQNQEEQQPTSFPQQQQQQHVIGSYTQQTMPMQPQYRYYQQQQQPLTADHQQQQQLQQNKQQQQPAAHVPDDLQQQQQLFLAFLQQQLQLGNINMMQSGQASSNSPNYDQFAYAQQQPQLANTRQLPQQRQSYVVHGENFRPQSFAHPQRGLLETQMESNPQQYQQTMQEIPRQQHYTSVQMQQFAPQQPKFQNQAAQRFLLLQEQQGIQSQFRDALPNQRQTIQRNGYEDWNQSAYSSNTSDRKAQSKHRGSSAKMQRFGSSDDFGSDDEPKRDIRKDRDIFGLSDEDFYS